MIPEGWIDRLEAARAHADVSGRETCSVRVDDLRAALLGIGELIAAAPPHASAPQEGEEGVIKEIGAERRRQIEVEGWSPGHDDEVHTAEELARAAACYALGTNRVEVQGREVWPWSSTDTDWKPSTRRCDLIKAGALIVAEIERLDRAEHEAHD